MSAETFESVIGLEIHAQLLTQSKMFCHCSTQFGRSDNANTCPVCVGMPGALPVLNSLAVDQSVLVGLALNCNIHTHSVFSRKNYFYPDLPKGYQISQYDQPLCTKGYVDIFHEGIPKRIGITRAHMEEDAGKSTHYGEYSVINLNRSSVPLLEIVSEPELRSPQEAAEYARVIRRILRYLKVCDGNLEQGSMRCDCNVSVRARGVSALGTKVEIKNINSFRFIEKALEYEIARQIECLKSKEVISQETRLYDVDKNKTFVMRTKEDAHDYRYFPDPDLLPVILNDEHIEKLKLQLPELPLAKMNRFRQEYGLSEYDAMILSDDFHIASYYERVVEFSHNPKASANWIIGDLFRELKDANLEFEENRCLAEDLGRLIVLIDTKIISGKIAKSVFLEMWKSQKKPEEIIDEKGLSQITNTDAIEHKVREIVLLFPSQLEEYRAGKTKLFGFFVGQIMKATKGQASPELVNQILKAVLEE